MKVTQRQLRQIIQEIILNEQTPRPPPPDTVVGPRPGSPPTPNPPKPVRPPGAPPDTVVGPRPGTSPPPSSPLAPRPVGAPPDTVIARPPGAPPSNLGPASIASRTAAAQAAARATATATGGWILPIAVAGLTGLAVGTAINYLLEKSGYADKIQDWMSKFSGKNEKEIKVRASLGYIYKTFMFDDIPDEVNVRGAIITIDDMPAGSRKVTSFSLRGVSGVLVDAETGIIIEKRTLSCITDFVSSSDIAIGTFKVSPGRVFIPNSMVGQIKLRSSDNDITYEGIISFPGSIAWDGINESYVGTLEYSKGLEG